MNCQEFRQLVDIYDDFSDNELASQKKIEFRIHGTECEHCKNEHIITKKIRTSLQRLNSIEVPANEIATFQRRLHNNSSSSAGLPLFSIFSLPRLRIRTLQFAGSFAILFLLFTFSNPAVKSPRQRSGQLTLAQMPTGINNVNNANNASIKSSTRSRLTPSGRSFKIAAPLSRKNHSPFFSPSYTRPSFSIKRVKAQRTPSSPLVFVANREQDESSFGASNRLVDGYNNNFNFKFKYHGKNKQNTALTLSRSDQVNDVYEERLEKYLMKKYAIRKLDNFQSSPLPCPSATSATIRGN